MKTMKKVLIATLSALLVVCMALAFAACDLFLDEYHSVTTDYDETLGTVTLSRPANGESYVYSELVTVTVTPNEGYDVVSFKVNDVETPLTDNTYTFEVLEDTTIAVVFDEVQYDKVLNDAYYGVWTDGEFTLDVSETSVKFEGFAGEEEVEFYYTAAGIFFEYSETAWNVKLAENGTSLELYADGDFVSTLEAKVEVVGIPDKFLGTWMGGDDADPDMHTVVISKTDDDYTITYSYMKGGVNPAYTYSYDADTDVLTFEYDNGNNGVTVKLYYIDETHLGYGSANGMKLEKQVEETPSAEVPEKFWGRWWRDDGVEIKNDVTITKDGVTSYYTDMHRGATVTETHYDAAQNRVYFTYTADDGDHVETDYLYFDANDNMKLHQGTASSEPTLDQHEAPAPEVDPMEKFIGTWMGEGFNEEPDEYVVVIAKTDDGYTVKFSWMGSPYPCSTPSYNEDTDTVSFTYDDGDLRTVKLTFVDETHVKYNNNYTLTKQVEEIPSADPMEKFIGTWMGEGVNQDPDEHTVIITKSGDEYTIKYKFSGGAAYVAYTSSYNADSDTLTFEYDNGTRASTVTLTYIDETHVLYCGEYPLTKQ